MYRPLYMRDYYSPSRAGFVCWRSSFGGTGARGRPPVGERRWIIKGTSRVGKLGRPGCCRGGGKRGFHKEESYGLCTKTMGLLFSNSECHFSFCRYAMRTHENAIFPYELYVWKLKTGKIQFYNTIRIRSVLGYFDSIHIRSYRMHYTSTSNMCSVKIVIFYVFESFLLVLCGTLTDHKRAERYWGN